MSKAGATRKESAQGRHRHAPIPPVDRFNRFAFGKYYTSETGRAFSDSGMDGDMNDKTLAIRILIAMYRSASRGRILTEATLAELTALEEVTLVEHLQRLDPAGYIDGPRLRLTLMGLAVAVAAAKQRVTPKRLCHAA